MTDTLRALREGLLCLVPSLLLAAAVLTSAALLDMLHVWPDLSAVLHASYLALTALTPLLVSASVGYMLAIKHYLPRGPTAFLCLGYAVLSQTILGNHSRAALSFLLVVAIVLPLLVVPALRWLRDRRWTRLTSAPVAGETVKNVINLIVPGILLGALVAAAVTLLMLVPGLDGLLGNLSLDIDNSPYRSGMIVAGLNSLLWFFGIHGYHALLPLFQQLDAAVPLAHAAAASGAPPSHIMNSAFLGAFAFVGGSGGTLSLALAILIVGRSKTLRVLAMASLPIGLFNVNEILLFALPIILNPRFLIPFIAVPIGNIAIALSATQAGLVAPATVLTPLNSPIGINAFLATGGDDRAVALQLVCLLVGILVYAPFVRHQEADTGHAKVIHLKSLDTTYTQLQEHAVLYAFDPVLDARASLNRRADTELHLETLSSREFLLMYQPQICRQTRRFVGCEALLRCRDSDGNEYAPATFLPWLERGNLMKQVDLWVAQTACRQHADWRQAGFDVPITINVTGASLADSQTCAAIVRQLSRAAGRLSIEITEESLVDDIDAIHKAIQQVHAIGAKVYIDDFGTGYSALGYLHRLAIDTIKVDRSFVLALAEEKGRAVMSGVLGLAKLLGLGVVVEGVETEAQLADIAADHPVSIQGWLFSKAIHADEIPAFIAARADGPPAAATLGRSARPGWQDA